MQILKRCGLAAASLVLSACASAPAPSPPPPADFTELAVGAAPARSVLYTDCIGQAIEASKVTHLADSDANLLRFTCSGAPAQRFFEALAVLGEAGSTWQAAGRTYRSTAKVRQNLFGVDYCSTGMPGGAVCQIILNTGPFLTATN